MPEASDRDILIEVRANVKSMHIELLGGEGRKGRIPKLEDTQEAHAEKINTFSGSFKAVLYVISGIGILLMAFGGVLLAHMWSGK